MDTREAIVEALAQRPWEELLAMRRESPVEDQALLAPLEHRAYAREQVSENPLMAIPFGAMVPAYQAYKAAGFALGTRGGDETRPSWDQVSHGYKGIVEGVKEWIRKRRDG